MIQSAARPTHPPGLGRDLTSFLSEVMMEARLLADTFQAETRAPL
jgi:hypothetical protein